MNKILSLILCSLCLFIVGCGSAGPETDEQANEKMKTLEQSSDYEKQMQEGMKK